MLLGRITLWTTLDCGYALWINKSLPALPPQIHHKTQKRQNTMLLECCDEVTGPTEDHLVLHFHVTVVIAVMCTVPHCSPEEDRGQDGNCMLCQMQVTERGWSACMQVSNRLESQAFFCSRYYFV